MDLKTPKRWEARFRSMTPKMLFEELAFQTEHRGLTVLDALTILRFYISPKQYRICAQYADKIKEIISKVC